MRSGWAYRALGDVCDIIGGGTPAKDKEQFYQNGTVPWATVRDMKSDIIDDTEFKITHEAIKSSSTNIIPEGNIIIATRVGLGKACLLAKDTAINQDLKGVIPKKHSKLLVGYLFQWFKNNAQTIQAQGTGATVQGVKLPFIRSLILPIPPIEEQQRIVAILDQAFDGIATAKANAEKNLKNAREIFESHLNVVFTQRGEGWVVTTIGKIGKASMCKRIFKDQTTASGDIPFYKIGTFGKEPDAFIPTHIYDEYRKNFSFPKKGDVLISASGTIGRRVRYDGRPAYFQDSNIVWIDNDETQVLNDFLYHFYGGCEWNSTKGATISRLYNDNLRQIEIAFPKSFGEQRDIICTIDALVAETQRLESIYQQKLTALDELKKSLLHQAFTGELTTLPDKQLDVALT